MTPGFIMIVGGVLILMLVMRRHLRLTGRRSRDERWRRRARSRRGDSRDDRRDPYLSTTTADSDGRGYNQNAAVHNDTARGDTGDCGSDGGSGSGGDCGSGGSSD